MDYKKDSSQVQKIIMIISIILIIIYTIAFEEKNIIKALLVFAHPDDETWMNGTIVKLVNDGYILHLIYVTSGDKGSDKSGRGLKDSLLAEEREKEVINALNTLGVVENISFLKYPDGKVQENISDISKEIEEKIKEIAPEIAFTFGPGGITGHTDHIGVGLATQLAFDRTKQHIKLYNIAINVERNDLLAIAESNNGINNFQQTELVNNKKSIRVNVSDVTYQRKLSPKSHKTQFPQPLLNAWDEFVSNSRYEEFIISRTKNKHHIFD